MTAELLPIYQTKGKDPEAEIDAFDVGYQKGWEAALNSRAPQQSEKEEKALLLDRINHLEDNYSVFEPSALQKQNDDLRKQAEEMREIEKQTHATLAKYYNENDDLRKIADKLAGALKYYVGCDKYWGREGTGKEALAEYERMKK